VLQISKLPTDSVVTLLYEHFMIQFKSDYILLTFFPFRYPLI